MDALHPSPGRWALFGEFLRRAREQRGLTIQQIARQTKIPWRHLEALEHGDLTAVPGGLYRRAEVRAFADAVGLDQRQALTALEQALGEADAGPPSNEGVPPPRPMRRTLLWVAAGALAAIVIVPLVAGRATERDGVPVHREPSPVPIDTAPPAAAQAAPVVPVPDVVPASESAPQPRNLRPAASGLPPAAASAEGGPTATPAPEPLAAPALAPLPEPVALPAPDPGSFVVTTDPPGARVVINGVGWGETPLTLRHLPPGRKRVRVIKDGYVSQEAEINHLGRRQPTSVHLTLQRPQ